MAVRFSDEQVVAATGARRLAVGPRASYLAICTDSRKLERDALFVALKGERFDGHAFLAQVAASGASPSGGAIGALVQKGVQLPELPADFGLFEVDDTLAALGGLARFHRQRFKGKVCAVGGSNGKTTTKELVGAILAAHGPSLKTEGNLNNEIGVPLTLFRLTPQHRNAVIEMGMNHPGEMARLTAIVQPDAALLTVIQEEHLEGLATLEGVAEAEGELFRGLRKEAIVVVNQDDPHVVAQARQSGAKKLTFGTGAQADVRRAWTQSRGLEGQRVGIVSEGREYEVTLSLVGEHNAHNATGAFALGRALNIPAVTCVRGLEAARPHARRLNVVELPNRITLLDDCYNANPGSMRAALSVLHELAGSGAQGGAGGGRRALAVLGDMLELGAGEEAAHRTLGENLGPLAAAAFFGPRSQAAFAAASAHGIRAAHFTEMPALLDWVRAQLKPDDVLLVKGSRGMKLERVVEALTGSTPSATGGH